MDGVCRNCFAVDRFVQSGTKPRCKACGSPRVVAHAELLALTIAHVDCDAFYASVEKRDRPELRDRPVIIGGGRRGVVATCCYIARTFGVRSAMPMFKATKLCPDAVIIGSDMEKYVRVSRQIRALMDNLTPAVQPISIDEAFLDLTGTERLHHASAAETLARFSQKVEQDIGITISVGLSHNKFLAKIASDLDKPRGFAVIGEAETLTFLAGHDVSLIWGVGKAMQKKLAADGIHTIAQLQTMEEAVLGKRYGSIGLRLARLARGQDSRRIESRSAAKSVSSETTFNRDLATAEELHPALRRLAEKVSARLKEKSIAGGTLVLKLKTADFRLRTRNRALGAPTQLADRIYSEGVSLLKAELDGTRFRLIGIGVSDLVDGCFADPPDLVDHGAKKRRAAEFAMDRIRARFGRHGVDLGLTFRARERKSDDTS